jgi:hypothetical protein
MKCSREWHALSLRRACLEFHALRRLRAYHLPPTLLLHRRLYVDRADGALVHGHDQADKRLGADFGRLPTLPSIMTWASLATAKTLSSTVMVLLSASTAFTVREAGPPCAWMWWTVVWSTESVTLTNAPIGSPERW